MHLKTLFFLIVLSGGLIPSYAFNNQSTFQDSAKKITIKIIATEKPRALNFDSLINNSQAAKPAKKANLSRRKPSGSTNSNNTWVKQKNVQERQVSKPVLKILPPKKSQNAVVNQNPNFESNSSPIAEHNEKIAPQQIKDDSTVIGDSADMKTARIYLWIGFMLIVVGIILGILFGKTALLISITGMIFVIIGYSINH